MWQDLMCIPLLILKRGLNRHLNIKPKTHQKKKRHVKTPPVYLFSTIWSPVEPGQPNRKNQRASFPTFSSQLSDLQGKQKCWRPKAFQYFYKDPTARLNAGKERRTERRERSRVGGGKWQEGKRKIERDGGGGGCGKPTSNTGKSHTRDSRGCCTTSARPWEWTVTGDQTTMSSPPLKLKK